jgi:hypothetical protein
MDNRGRQTERRTATTAEMKKLRRRDVAIQNGLPRAILTMGEYKFESDCPDNRRFF